MSTQFDLLILTVLSIEKNAKSLAEQLMEFEHLYVTKHEQIKLDVLERTLHSLVEQITERKP